MLLAYAVTMSASIVSVRHLSIQRDGVFLLRDVSFEMRAGEHWVLLGPNGSGKTSLLRALMAYLHGPGEIHVLGEEYGAYDWAQLRKRVGMVSSALTSSVPDDEPAWRTVLSGREAMLGHWGESSPEQRQEAQGLLERVQCGGLTRREWGVLSQGERQRVLFARALMARPALMILDEPCAGLDIVARARFLDFLEAFGADAGGPRMLLVTHHVEEIVPAFTHVLVLSGGQVVAAGPKREVLTDETLTKAFGAPVRITEREGRYEARLALR